MISFQFAALERIERDAWRDPYAAAHENVGEALQVASAMQSGAAPMAMGAIDQGLFNRT